jgi:peptide/nickel transport system substrate-binding protein
MRAGRLVLLVATLALLAVGPAAARRTGGRYGGVLSVGLTSGDPGSLDPTLSSTFSAVEIYRSICERLYDFDTRSRVFPELAAALPTLSSDKQTYTIPLRHGIVFNDGTPFNAQAVVTSLERMLTNPGSTRASNYGPIDSVTAGGQYTVVIHVSSRFQPLLADLATNDGIVMSPAQLQKLGDNFGTDPICVGPYTFDHWVAGDNVTVIKSPYYYDKYAVHYDKIVYRIMDAASATAALQAGDIQVLDSLSPADVQGNSSIRTIQGGGLGWQGLMINLGNQNGVGNPFKPLSTPLASSPLLRRAFEEAIDRATFVKVVLDGLAIPDCIPISPRSTDYVPVKCTPYDPADARALVAKSGIPNPTVHLMTTSAGAAEQFIQAEEAAVGINVVFDVVDNVTHNSREFSGNFDVDSNAFTGTPATDRNVFQFLASSGSRNFGGYSNPRFDLILANARKAFSPKARRTLIGTAEQILLQDRPIIFLDHPIVYAGVSTSVKGVQFFADRQLRVAFAQPA